MHYFLCKKEEEIKTNKYIHVFAHLSTKEHQRVEIQSEIGCQQGLNENG